MRREPKLGVREKPSLWVDFYHKKDWKESRQATSTVLALLQLETEIMHGLFLMT